MIEKCNQYLSCTTLPGQPANIPGRKWIGFSSGSTLREGALSLLAFFFPSLFLRPLPLFLSLYLPLSRTRGPARLVEVLELAPSASSDTPTAWLPCPAAAAPRGGPPMGCCTAAAARSNTKVVERGRVRNAGDTCASSKQSLDDRMVSFN